MESFSMRYSPQVRTLSTENCFSFEILSQLFKKWINHYPLVENSIDFDKHLSRWIVIYPVQSAIHPLKTKAWCGMKKKFTSCKICVRIFTDYHQKASFNSNLRRDQTPFVTNFSENYTIPCFFKKSFPLILQNYANQQEISFY